MKNFILNLIKALANTLLLFSLNISIAQTFTDAGMLEIHSPSTSYNEGDTVDVLIEFQNFGTDSIFALDLAYELNAGIPIVTAWTGTLAPGETDSVNLPYIVIPAGSTELCIYTLYSADTFPSNDTMCISIYGNPQNNAGVNTMMQIPEIQGYYPVYATIFNQGTLPLQSAIIEWKIDNIVHASFN